MNSLPAAEHTANNVILAFGPFRFIRSQRVLLRSGVRVALSKRASTILLLLLERAGELISKSEIIAHVWPDTLVDEAALRVYISGLRKALEEGKAGMHYVENVTGHGYRFIAPVTRIEELPLPQPEAGAAESPNNIPLPLPAIIGREKELSRLASQLPQRRFMTIVGPGGIGKTTIAIAASHRLRAADFSDIFFVDLSSIVDPALVPASIASAMGLPLVCADVLADIVKFLENRRTLLLLDNCEQVVEAAAHVTEKLLALAPGLHILATSREPLRVAGESVLRLAPLALPQKFAPLSVADALKFSAVDLFAQRATESISTFELAAADVSLVVDICHKLDGLPLAIELAAALVGVFGIRGIAANLDDRLKLLAKGHRTASPRHQTLRAALDWSYETLSPTEQTALRRLAVFAGNFDFASADAVLADERIDAAKVLDIVMDLVSKSLVMTSMTSDNVFFHLLETSRSYALEKLDESEESDEIKRRHARLCCTWGDAASDWDWQFAGGDNESASRKIHDVRTALEWCLSTQGDQNLGVQLVAASAPLWLQLYFHSEYLGYIERALRALGDTPTPDHTVELRLNAALGDALMFEHNFDPRVAKAFARTLELAERVGHNRHRTQALWGLWLDRIVAGDYRHAIRLAEMYRTAAETIGAPGSTLTSDQMLSFALHLGGDHAGARVHIEGILNNAPESAHSIQGPGQRFDNRVAAYTELARIHWMQGFPEQAVLTVRDGVRRARSIDHAPSLCRALNALCLIATWTGDLERVRRTVAALLDCANRHSIPHWQIWGRYQQRALAARDDLMLSQLQIEMARDPHCTTLVLDHMATLHPLLATPGALERAENGEAGWCTAEILRAKAVQLLTQNPANAPAAEKWLQRSLDVARKQGELSWELRTALTLSRLRKKQGRISEARDLLSPLFDRFTEGFATADLLEARLLLMEL